jgi:hypothetical protein
MIMTMSDEGLWDENRLGGVLCVPPSHLFIPGCQTHDPILNVFALLTSVLSQDFLLSEIKSGFLQLIPTHPLYGGKWMVDLFGVE